MSAPFSRTLQALDRDRGGGGLAVVAAILVLGAWVAWAGLARVTLVEVTDRGRIEARGATHPVEPRVGGVVLESLLAVGRRVRPGDVLVRLEAQHLVIGQLEQKERIAGLERQLGSLRGQLDAEADAGRGEQEMARLLAEQSPAKKAEVDADRELWSEEARRLGQLHGAGYLGELELLRARTEAKKRTAMAEALGLDALRLRADLRTRKSGQRARQAELLREVAWLEGDLALARAAQERIALELEHHTVRASAGGVIAEAAELLPGRVVRAGERLATLVPDADLHVVAELAPAAALGRVRPGQRAALRLDGFPWTEYGTVAAVVSSVAGEARDGLVRVELALDPARASPVPLQHGLPGSVEIEVERVSPAALLLRAAGLGLGRPAAPAPAPAGPVARPAP